MAKPYPAAVPDQQFQPIATAIPEGIGAPIAGRLANALLNQCRQAIDTHAHIHRLHSQIDILGYNHFNQLDSQRPRESASSTGQRISAFAPFLASAISMRCRPVDSSPGLTEIGTIMLTGFTAGIGKLPLRDFRIHSRSRLAFNPCAKATAEVETPGWQSATTLALNSGEWLRRRRMGGLVGIDGVH